MARLLWKTLNATDFNGMSGSAAVSGSGGGARHIVLGKSTPENDVDGFLPIGHGNQVAVTTEAGPAWPAATLTFRTNPERRSGEWLIVDQKNHRHPAWTTLAGFPASFNAANRPVILVIEVDGVYHVAWLDQATLKSIAPAISGKTRGVTGVPPGLLVKIGMCPKSTLEAFDESAAVQPPVVFDPADQEDARKRTFAEVVRRQGQTAFRKELVKAYGGKCPITGCAVLWVLEAAHISPYRGTDTNKPDNGLLLRADVHTLFDLGLLSVHPDTLTIRVAQRIADDAYRALDGCKLRTGTVQPSKLALKEHWDRSTP